MKIIQAFITKDTSYQNNVNKVDSRYTTFQKRGPVGLMLHSVGTPQPDASVFAKGWNRAGREASVHAVLQADGTVYQTMPWNFRAWHAGGSANNTHIGVEMTEPGCIHYTTGARFTCDNLAQAQAQVRGTYNTAVELFAYLCKQYKLDPLKDIISHYEGSKKGVASDHGDPEHLWNGLNMGYTMDGFRKAVKEKMEEVLDNMTKDELKNMLDERDKKLLENVKKMLDDSMGGMINTIDDIPWKSVRKEMREILDYEAIDGGTDYANDPDDINLPLNLIRALVGAKRYDDKKYGELPCQNE